MIPPSFFARSLRAALLIYLLPLSWVGASEPIQIVFQNGRGVAVSAVALQGGKLVITAPADGFTEGQSFAPETADHVYGEKPAELNQGIALLLLGQPKEALKLLEPIVASQRVTAKIPGNFWMEAAQGALVAHALEGNSPKLNEIGKEISDATPVQGIDPFVSLGKALTLPLSAGTAERETAFRDLTTDNLPAAICAYAAFYRAELLLNVKRSAELPAAQKQDMETLEAYLMVPCLFPSGGKILNAASELAASRFLTTLGRREEAVALLSSAIRRAPGTVIATEANKRLESSK